MNKLLENLNCYLDILDKWEGQERNKTVGAYSFLSEDLLVRSIVVSPNLKYGMSALKTFFATDVLEIHPDKPKSKLSYKEIQAHLEGKLGKKYKFDYTVLEKCGQREANLEAFLTESGIMQKHTNLCELVRNCDEELPYIVLDQMRKTVWGRLYKYNFVCGEAFCKDCERRKELYYQFTQAVALFEMFFIECVQQPIRESVELATERVRKASEQMEQLRKTGSVLTEKREAICEQQRNLRENAGMQVVEEILSLAEGCEKVVMQDLEGMEEILDKISVFSLLEAEFGVELCAMYHILLIMESVNVYDDETVEEPQIGLNMDVTFLMDYNKNFKTFGRTNANRSVSYRRVNEYLEEMLAQYTDRSYDVKKKLMAFLKELSAAGERKTQKYYELMGELAYPVYRRLGGEK